MWQLMDIFNQIAERKILEAIERGEFNNLSNHGQKLDLRSDPFIPPELQLGYKLLKNAGMIPEELVLNQEIQSLRGLLDTCPTHQDEQEIRHRIRQKLLMLDILKERNGRSIALQDYMAKIESL